MVGRRPARGIAQRISRLYCGKFLKLHQWQITAANRVLNIPRLERWRGGVFSVPVYYLLEHSLSRFQMWTFHFALNATFSSGFWNGMQDFPFQWKQWKLEPWQGLTTLIMQCAVAAPLAVDCWPHASDQWWCPAHPATSGILPPWTGYGKTVYTRLNMVQTCTYMFMKLCTRMSMYVHVHKY